MRYSAKEENMFKQEHIQYIYDKWEVCCCNIQVKNTGAQEAEMLGGGLWKFLFDYISLLGETRLKALS